MFKICNVFDGSISSEDELAISRLFSEIDLSEEGKTRLSNRPLPQRQTAFSAAYDLSLPYTVTIAPGEEKRVYFGWKIINLDMRTEKENDQKAMLTARSSLCKKKGLMLTNSFSLFKGGNVLQTVLVNVSNAPVTIEQDERIVQLLFVENNSSYNTFDCANILPVSGTPSSLLDSFVFPKGKRSNFLFQAHSDVVLLPGKVTFVMTSIKWRFSESEVLFLEPDTNLSSLVYMSNGIGVVDSDYFDNADNEGEIGFPLINIGSLPITLPAGTPLGVGVLCTYFTVEGDVVNGKRTGGMGSTDAEG